MADPFEELRDAGINIGTKVYVSTLSGHRIFTRLPTGEMDRTIEESHLVPSSPQDASTIYILPKPTAEYESRPYDMLVPARYFRTAMVEIDRRHGIQSVEAFAAHPNGTNPCTEQLLPPRLIKMDEDDFTMWCTLTLTDGTESKIIKVSP